VIGCIAAGRKFSLGSRLSAFSGQVLTQSPHCTQALSVNRSLGSPGVSMIAAVGQADVQAMHSVQAALSMPMRP
jgi:hypothetical protein